MTDPIYPDQFLAEHPRYMNESVTKELVPGTYAVVLVSQVHINVPDTGRMNAYSSLTESIVTIPAMLAEEPIPRDTPTPSISADKQLGGVELSADELNGLPGAPEFFSALHGLVLEKFQAINNPTP